MLDTHFLLLLLQILVKKSYGDKQRRHKLRNWKLQELDKEMEVATNLVSRERDYTEFLETLEEDETYRQNVNIYHGKICNIYSETSVQIVEMFVLQIFCLFEGLIEIVLELKLSLATC